MQEKEWFAAHAPAIAEAPSAALRDILIEVLKNDDPTVYAALEADRHQAESTSHFVRVSGRFVHSAVGDLNTYPLFVELSNEILRVGGSLAGIVCPTGLITEKNNSGLFRWLVESNRLQSIYDFSNKREIFTAVDRNQRFSLVTMGTMYKDSGTFKVSFAQQSFDKIDEAPSLSISGNDLALFNPDTGTCPLFNTEQDFRISLIAYKRYGVWIAEGDAEEANPWSMRFAGMFHMTNDSTMSVPRAALAAFSESVSKLVNLYEAKMIGAFNHRFASSDAPQAGNKIRGSSIETMEAEHQTPHFSVTSRYLVLMSDALSRKPNLRRKWIAGIRAVAGAVANIRPLVAAILPLCGAGNSLLTFDCADTFTALSRDCQAWRGNCC